MVILNSYDITREAFLKRGEEFGDMDLSGVAFTNFQDGKASLSFHIRLIWDLSGMIWL